MDHDQYLHWSGDIGEEPWFQLDSSRNLIGMNPPSGATRQLELELSSRSSGHQLAHQRCSAGVGKWELERTGRKVVQTLVEKTEKVVPGRGEWAVHYAFFSRQAFTPPAKKLGAANNAVLVTLGQIELDIRWWMDQQGD